MARSKKDIAPENKAMGSTEQNKAYSYEQIKAYSILHNLSFNKAAKQINY